MLSIECEEEAYIHKVRRNFSEGTRSDHIAVVSNNGSLVVPAIVYLDDCRSKLLKAMKKLKHKEWKKLIACVISFQMVNILLLCPGLPTKITIVFRMQGP